MALRALKKDLIYKKILYPKGKVMNMDDDKFVHEFKAEYWNKTKEERRNILLEYINLDSELESKLKEIDCI